LFKHALIIFVLGLTLAAQAQTFPTKPVRIITPFPVGTSATAGPLYRAGKLKFLAIAAPKRLPAYKDVPTVAEAGGPKDFEVSGMTVIAAPRGLPKAVADKISADIAKALAEPDMREKFVSFGYELFTPSREQFGQYIQAESARQAAVILKAKAALD
jgi:tripartite-type tricarboxylate transporter receptor subunit TctC